MGTSVSPCPLRGHFERPEGRGVVTERGQARGGGRGAAYRQRGGERREHEGDLHLGFFAAGERATNGGAVVRPR
jgi:hypothetical protein